MADFITPLIAAIGGKPDFSSLSFTINDSKFRYGDFLNALLSFLIIAAVVFFFVVKPVNALLERYSTERDAEVETRECPECVSKIPVTARRCAFCTSEVAAAPGPRIRPSARSSVDRVLASGARSRRFESCRARHLERNPAVCRRETFFDLSVATTVTR